MIFAISEYSVIGVIIGITSIESYFCGQHRDAGERAVDGVTGKVVYKRGLAFLTSFELSHRRRIEPGLLLRRTGLSYPAQIDGAQIGHDRRRRRLRDRC